MYHLARVVLCYALLSSITWHVMIPLWWHVMIPLWWHVMIPLWSDEVWCDIIMNWILSILTPYRSSSPRMCLCFRWLAIFCLAPCSHFRAKAPEKKHIRTISTYSISNGKCPTFCCNYAWSSQAIIYMALRLLATLLLCCVFVSFIHLAHLFHTTHVDPLQLNYGQ